VRISVLPIRVLDTNICVAVLRGHRQVVERFADEPFEDLRLSAITVFELNHGAAKSGRAEEFAKVRTRLTSLISLVELSPSDAEAGGKLRADLETRGEIIGAYDLLIAGQALARDWTVVTANTREFARVRGLRTEDWTAAS
jgi:tRNA(fMet)-specific endonuclease VapC